MYTTIYIMTFSKSGALVFCRVYGVGHGQLAWMRKIDVRLLV